MGGTDDPTNLVMLTVEEHAEAHRLLYLEHGKIEDYLAWQGLAKLKDKGAICADFGRLGPQARSSTNVGKKYRPYPRTKGPTQGQMWFHNPNNPTQKTCVKDMEEVPDGWVRGQGRKAVNPGSNFRPARQAS